MVKPKELLGMGYRKDFATREFDAQPRFHSPVLAANSTLSLLVFREFIID
jgi:hypothetical protein